MHIKYYGLFLVLLIVSPISAHYQKVFILIHGTWAAQNEWCMPGGDFYDELAHSAEQKGACTIPFVWSGKFDHDSRVQGAAGLVKVIQSYPPECEIYIAGHSHGGNIATLASQIMGKDPTNNHRIAAIYLLATPIKINQYLPDMNIVHVCYNLFSFRDKIQPVFGAFKRELPPHPRSANILVTIDDAQPDHSTMHAAVIGRWIPFIHEHLAQQCINNFELFDFTFPGIIHFNTAEAPRYDIDINRSVARQRDIIETQELLRNAYLYRTVYKSREDRELLSGVEKL